MQLIKIRNPFQRHTASVETHAYEGKSMRDFVCEFLADLNKEREKALVVEEMEGVLRTTINGTIVPYVFWNQSKPREQDIVTISPIVGKSEETKQIMNLAIMIVASVWFAPAMAGGQFTGGLGFSAEWMALGTALITAGVGVTLSYFTPKPEKEDPNTNDFGNSSTYSFNPNATQAQGPIGKWYGKMRVHPNIISMHTEVPANPWSDPARADIPNVTLHKLNLLCCFSHGPIEGIITDEILLNNQPVANFSNTVITERKGTTNQTVLPSFGSTKLEYFPNKEFDLDTGPIVWTTPDNDFDELEIEILYPRGLYSVNSAGNRTSRTVEFQVEVSEHEADSWTTWALIRHTNNQMGANRFHLKTSEDYTGKPNFKTYNNITITNGKRYDIRCTRIPLPGEVTDLQQIEMRLGTVREEIEIGFTYPNLSLLEVESLATDTLSGSFDVSAVLEGSIVNVYDGASWNLEYSNNPAWVIWDILTRPLITGDGSSGDPYAIARYDGVNPNKLDADKFWELAEWCDDLVDDGNGSTEKRITFNGGFDISTNPKQAADRVCQVARCKLYQNGSTWTLAIDKADTATQMFQASTIKDGSFKRTYFSQQELASEIEIHFNDEAFDYKRVPMVMFDPALQNRTKILTMDLFGVTKESEAWRAGQYRLAQNKYLKSSIEFRTDLDAIASVPGDVIKVAHDTPQWGKSGITQSGTALGIITDKDIVYEDTSGIVYELLVRKNDGALNILTVQSAFEGIIDVTIGSKTFQVSGDHTSEFKDGDSIRVADSTGNDLDYTLNGDSSLNGSDTDIVVNETIADATIDGGLFNLRRVTVTTPFLDKDGEVSAPKFEDTYAFGEQSVDVRTYRMTGIKRSSDLVYTIAAVEYNANVYGPDGSTPVLPLTNYVAPVGDNSNPLAFIVPPVTKASIPPQEIMGASSYDVPMLTNVSWTDTLFTNDEYIRFRLDDNLENTAVRDAANSNNGEFVSPSNGNNTDDVSIAGKRSRAFQFNLSDYIDCLATHSGKFGLSFTVSMFIKPDDGRPTVDQYLFGTKTGANDMVYAFLDTSGKLTFKYTSNGNNGNDAVTNVAVFADGAIAGFHHIAFVADSTIGGVGGKKIYFDGVEVTLDASDDGSTSGVTFASITLNEDLFVGAYNNEGVAASPFDGGMDDWKLYDRALSDSEILSLANLQDEEVYWDATINDSIFSTPILVTFNGTSYEIDDGETTDRFIYWDENDPDVFNSTNVLDDAVSDGRWMMGENIDGVVTQSFGAKFINVALLKAGGLKAELGIIDELSVGSLQLQGNSVTIPVSSYTSGAIAVGTSLTTIAQAAISTVKGAPVRIELSFAIENQSVGSSRNLNQVDVVRESTTIFSSTIVKPLTAQAGDYISVVFEDNPDADTVSTAYYVKAKSTHASDMQASRRSLLLMTVKK